MKSNPKGVVLKGGVTDPRLPGKVFFGPGVRKLGFILRKLREQVVEIGKEMSSYVRDKYLTAKGGGQSDEAKVFVQWLGAKLSEARALEKKALAGGEVVKSGARDWDAAVETPECGEGLRDRALQKLRRRFHVAGMCFVDEVLRVQRELSPRVSKGREMGRADIVRLVREVYTSDELRRVVLPGEERCRKPSIQRATNYVHKLATGDSRFYDRIVDARMRAKTMYKNSAYGEMQFWNSIAQTAKSSHGRKKNKDLTPVPIPTGWR